MTRLRHNLATLAIALLFGGLLLLFAAAVAEGQVRISVGMLNAGKLANEKTHHVRMGSSGDDLYIGLGIDAGVVAFKLLHMPTHLVVWKCAENPCEPLSRWHHRAPQEAHAEPFAWTTAAVGVKYRQLSAGLTANVIHGARPHFWGATPMLTVGVWGELRATYRGVGVEFGASLIPPQPARYVTLEEHSGGKQNGQPITYRQRTIVALYVGAVVGVR